MKAREREREREGEREREREREGERERERAREHNQLYYDRWSARILPPFSTLFKLIV